MEIILSIDMDEDLKEQVIADMGKWIKPGSLTKSNEGWQWGPPLPQQK